MQEPEARACLRSGCVGLLSPNPFCKAKPLKYFIEHLADLPRWSWLYISGGASAITLDILCHPMATDTIDLSEDEIGEFEAYVETIALRSFFCRDQLEDIISNLKSQRPDFTPEQLALAIDFYWTRDAFIDLSKPAS